MRVIHIKNMVCKRCVLAVNNIFLNENLNVNRIELGELEIFEEPSIHKLKSLQDQLNQLGFELIEDRKERLAEKIKNLIVANVHHGNEPIKRNLSHYLTEQLPYEYNYLSNLFSEVTGITIEKFYINHKIEKVKELLIYDELSLSEIADQLGYSSAAYLSNQFKKITGFTPGHFKSLSKNNRRNIEEL